MPLLLRRHDLVWLSREGWEHLLRQPQAPDVAACLEHWCGQRLPLVVGRQAPDQSGLALGLAAPIEWGRRKIALQVPDGCVLYHDGFPAAREVGRLVLPSLRQRWVGLWQSLAELRVQTRVHGSHGWQRLTGLRYLTPRSDMDLLMPVPDAGSADAVAACLHRFDWEGPRIDGELLFPGGSAVAWREWLQWRLGAVDRILVKRLHGVELEQGLGWLGQSAVAAT
jgi:phosphoribosyl-dephospho-CoA transferase